MEIPTTPSNNAPTTPRWQRALAGFSLSLVTLVVALPVGAGLLMLWALVLVIAAAQTMQSAGVLKAGDFDASLLIASIGVGVIGLFSLISQSVGLRRRGAQRTLVDVSARPGRWLWQHPWITTGLAFTSADVVLLPLDRSDVVDVHVVLVGALMLGSGFWLLGTLTYGLVRGWVAVVGLVFGGVRRSSFFAGMVVVCSLFVTGAALLLGAGVAGLVARQANARYEPLACGPSAVDCARVAVVDIATPRKGTPQVAAPPPPPPQPASPSPPLVFPPPTSEQAASFDRCVEELYRQDATTRMSPRDIGAQLAARVVGKTDEVEDIVHSAMVTVCLTAYRIEHVVPYFYRSIKNAAGKWKARSRRWCPLEPESPPPALICSVPDSLSGAVPQDMEIAVYTSLCELDGDARRILEMRFWQNLSHAQIGAQLGISVVAARKRYSRAIDELRAKFQQRCQ